TTNLINALPNPQNLPAVYDTRDNPAKGTVDYSGWLAVYQRPGSPTLQPVATPTTQSVQLLQGSKDAGTAILVNGMVAVAPDDQIDWSYALTLHEGTNALTIQARSPEGLTSDVVSVRVVLDTTPPRLFSSNPADGAHVAHALSLVELTLLEQTTEIDATATLASAVLTSGTGQLVSGTWDVRFNRVSFVPDVALADGVYRLDLTPTDSPLGNSAAASIEFTVDQTAPVGLALDPVQSPTQATPQTLTGTKESQSGIWLDGILIVPIDEQTTWSYPLPLLEGQNDHVLFARDAAGNRGVDVPFSIVLDRQAPQLAGTEPGNGAINVRPARIAFLLLEPTTQLDIPTTLASAQFLDAQGQSVAGQWSVESGTTVVFVPDEALAEGSYSARITAADVAGNNRGYDLSFRLDMTPPAAPALNPVTSPTNFIIQALTGTKEADTAILFSDEVVVPLGAATSWSYTVTLVEGINSYTIRARDAAGNRGPPVTTTIVYDETSPLPVTALLVDGAGNGTSALLDWTGYDEAIQGDVASYRIYAAGGVFTQVDALTPIAELAAGTFTYRIEDLTRNTAYWFAVVAVDTKGNANGSVTPVSTTLSDVIGPEPPSALAVESYADRVIVHWQSSPNSAGDLAGYRAHFGEPETVTDLDSSLLSFEASALQPASGYPFRIQSIDND
ncbi:MAG: Ig-like domain-containing protein, partial [Gammaproteobacteria bacterium]|nr:Ig-like domain-containing protein [Gammaproteobacteria bacterium]